MVLRANKVLVLAAARPTGSAQRLLWIVAMATGIENFLQAFDAAIDGSTGRFVLWLGGALLVAAMAAWAENIKAQKRE